MAIGNFDGVHLGHQALLAELRRQAARINGPAVAMTFDPPPAQLLRPTSSPSVLTTLADRTRLMQAHGADHVLVMQTTPELLQKTARQFFDCVIKSGLAAGATVPGFNFAFGHNREGTVETLTAMCREAGMACAPVPPLHVGGQPVSSSRIRALLLGGEADTAGTLLGRPYRITANVTTGQRRGQTLGFPTANLDKIATLIPGNGVYAARASTPADAGPRPPTSAPIRPSANRSARSKFT